jgi:hypothetical protein
MELIQIVSRNIQLLGGSVSLLIFCFICEVDYVLTFIRTANSRFTSTTIKRNRQFLLLRDSKYTVELAVASARFMPSGHIILPGGLMKKITLLQKPLKI